MVAGFRVVIDESGRLVLPEPVRKGLDLREPRDAEVTVTDTGIVITLERDATPITKAIGAMDLPVAEWEEMEREIEMGRQS